MTFRIGFLAAQMPRTRGGCCSPVVVLETLVGVLVDEADEVPPEVDALAAQAEVQRDVGLLLALVGAVVVTPHTQTNIRQCVVLRIGVYLAIGCALPAGKGFGGLLYLSFKTKLQHKLDART